MILNEATYLREWIGFHRAVGIDHFYLYDNGSTDATSEVLDPFAAKGIVTVSPWRTFLLSNDIHAAAYAHAVVNFGRNFRWFVFIDADEFIFSTGDDSLPQALEPLDEYAAIRVPRHEFGPGGHQTAPDGLVTENYLYSSTSAKFKRVKSIAKPAFIVSPRSHTTLVDGRTLRLDQPPGNISSGLRINHYFTKSEAEFAAKLERGWRGGDTPERAQRKNRQKRQHYAATLEEVVYDDAILRFVGRFKSSEVKFL